MTTTHTPGPWENSGHLAIKAGHIQYSMTASTAYPSKGGLTTTAADVRLMAAAPDLLAALQSIVASADANCGDSLANAINTARAAIAKAGGAA